MPPPPRVDTALLAALRSDLERADYTVDGVRAATGRSTPARPGRDVWTSWLDGTGLDAWVVQRDEQDPAEYAELWAGDAGSRCGAPGYEDLYAAWLADFADRGVERVGFGVAALQRPARDRTPWADLVDHRGPVGGAMGRVVDAASPRGPGWPSTTTTRSSTSPGPARRT